MIMVLSPLNLIFNIFCQSCFWGKSSNLPIFDPAKNTTETWIWGPRFSTRTCLVLLID